MHDSSKLKKEFVKNWFKGLQICRSSSKKQMNIMERKKKIKLSADIALASAKNATTSWSRALLSCIQKDDQNKLLVDNIILAIEPAAGFKFAASTSCRSQMVTCHKRSLRSKKVLEKRRGASRRLINKKMEARLRRSKYCIAKRLVKKRTEVLKRLVPGGKSMDEVSIIKEALDYILSLRVQVDVMKNLLENATNVV